MIKYLKRNFTKMHVVEPLASYFQVRYVKGKVIKRESSLILVEKKEEKQRIVQVLAAGPGQYNPFNGGYFDHGIKVGDLIYVNQHAPVVVKDLKELKGEGEEESFLIAESDIYAVYMRYQEAVDKGIIDPLTEE